MALAAACVGLGGCGDPTPASSRASETRWATARADDPPLTESWRMPEGTSALVQGDLGSAPPALSEALMVDHAAAGISHRVAMLCAQRGALASVESLALRFEIGGAGTLARLDADPPGRAAACTTEALRAELESWSTLPAGAALMVLRFSASPRS